jgi:hypothetical protein
MMKKMMMKKMMMKKMPLLMSMMIREKIITMTIGKRRKIIMTKVLQALVIQRIIETKELKISHYLLGL